VPPTGNSKLQHWSNDIDGDKNAKDDVVAVTFTVVKVRTSDLDWKSVSYDVDDGASVSAAAPSVK